MKIPVIFGLVATLCLSSCRKPPTEVTVTETRETTAKDGIPKLGASSDERFRANFVQKSANPLSAPTPKGWLELPSSQFRLLNYRFGESGMGEVAVGIAGGSLLDNINRWMDQFQTPPLSQADLAKSRRIPIVGVQGVWVEAEGSFKNTMGSAEAEPTPGYALAGVIAEVNGKILTVKMTGPKGEVEAARGALEEFCQSLQLTAVAPH